MKNKSICAIVNLTMDIKQLRGYLPMLHSLNKCKGNCERNILMSHLEDKSFNFVCKMIGKTVNDPSMLGLSPSKLNHLRLKLTRDRARVKYLTKDGGVMTRKRRSVRQSGEGIGAILGILLPIVINLISGAFKKKKK